MLIKVQRHPEAAWPFGDVWNFEREVGDLFKDFLGTTTLAPRIRTYPTVDIAEYPNETVVVAELPGVRKEDVKISVQGDVLTISGERKGHEKTNGNSWLHNEIHLGQFSRSFELPHAVETNNISAELINGVLRITLPKAEQAKAREIHVK